METAKEAMAYVALSAIANCEDGCKQCRVISTVAAEYLQEDNDNGSASEKIQGLLHDVFPVDSGTGQVDENLGPAQAGRNDQAPEELKASLRRVEELHRKVGDWCDECGTEFWPCRTIQAIGDISDK